MWVDDNSDEGRLITKFKSLSKEKKRTLLESLTAFKNWVKDVLWDIWLKIRDSIGDIWVALQGWV